MIDLDGCVADFMLEVSAQIHSLVKGDTIIIKPDEDIPLDCFGYIVSKSLGKKLEKYIEANPDRHSGDGIYPIDEDEAKEKTCRSLIMAIASQEGFFRELLPLDNGLWLAIKDAQGLEFLSATIGEYGYKEKEEWVRTVLQSDVPVIDQSLVCFERIHVSLQRRTGLWKKVSVSSCFKTPLGGFLFVSIDLI